MAIAPAKNADYFINPEGREMTSHGTPMFPAAFYHDQLEAERVPWHWHDEMEVIVIERGEMTVFTGSQRHLLRRGQGLFINPDILHAAQGAQSACAGYHSLVFHPRLIGGDVDSVFWQDYLRPLMSSGLKCLTLDGSQLWHENALECIEKAWKEGAEDAAGYEFRVRAALSELIFLMVSHLPRDRHPVSEKGLRDGKRIKQMLRFIQLNYTDPITVREIARSAMLSESECLRCFRSTINMAPIQYVKRFRVQKAAEMLTSTDEKIAEIGALSGFQDTSYFTRTFREIKGMTPGEYRMMKKARRGSG